MVKKVPFVSVIPFTDKTVNYLTEDNIPAFYYSVVHSGPIQITD